MLTVRTSTLSDFPQLLRIYAAARAFMAASGNPGQWGTTHPPEALIREDIRRGVSYVVCEEGRVHGTFVLLSGEEPTYRVIEDGAWLSDAPYLTIHRVASDGAVHGVFTCAADYSKALSGSVRVDTHPLNLPMQRQIARNGFTRCGIIHVADGSPRIAYQWLRAGTPQKSPGREESE